MTQRVRVQNFTVSRDGIGAGERQTPERPFGHVDPGDLMSWAFDTVHFPGRAAPGGSRGLEGYLTRDFSHGIGAEIMGRHKFGPQRDPWPDDGREGWWGPEPAVRSPRCASSSTLV